MQTISFERIHKNFGYPKSILIILLSDYDVAGTPIDIKGEQWVGIRGSTDLTPYKKIYSSVSTTTLIKSERTQISYNYLFLDGTNVTTNLVSTDCNCCYFDSVQGTTTNANTESILNARRANVMLKNCAFTGNKTESSITCFLSGYNSTITLDSCSISVRNLSCAVSSFASRINGSISYIKETRDDNINYDLSIVRHSAIPTSLPANGGNADTVNYHTVADDVPEGIFATLPFRWELIGTSGPETSETSSNTFSQTMSSGSPFFVYHSSGVFCFSNGVPANRGTLYGPSTGAAASATYTSAGLLTVEVGSGTAYIYQMKTIQ